MSGNFYDESDSRDEFADNSGRGLRAQLESALGEIRELKAQLTESRKESAKSLLQDKGLDPVLIELAPKDEDPVEWVSRVGHLLGAKDEQKSTESKEAERKMSEPEVVAPSEEDPAIAAEREARKAMQEAAEAGSQSTVETDLISQMDKISSEKELLEFFKRNGAVGG